MLAQAGAIPVLLRYLPLPHPKQATAEQAKGKSRSFNSMRSQGGSMGSLRLCKRTLKLKINSGVIPHTIPLKVIHVGMIPDERLIHGPDNSIFKGSLPKDDAVTLSGPSNHLCSSP